MELVYKRVKRHYFFYVHDSVRRSKANQGSFVWGFFGLSVFGCFFQLESNYMAPDLE